MEGSTDRGFLGFGHKKEEQKNEQPFGTQPAGGTYGDQQQQLKPEHGTTGYSTSHQQTTTPATGTYSAAPGVPQTEGEGQGHKPGLMGKIGETLTKPMEKLKKGHKKSGSSSSSSSDEEDNAEGKKKHGIF